MATTRTPLFRASTLRGRRPSSRRVRTARTRVATVAWHHSTYGDTVQVRKVGFHGGSRICDLGPAPDMVLFFNCLRRYAQDEHPGQGWALLTDRLYRRYLRREELEPARALMEQARQIFSGIPAASAVEWDPAMLSNPEKSWLKPEQPTLADVFSKYFESWVTACNSADSFFDAFNIYQPVRVVISDLAGFARDKKKPLADYDALSGEPFWLQ